MDHILRELLEVNQVETFNFFSSGLQDVLGGKRFDPDQMLYVASVLAHYTQIPRQSDNGMPLMANLDEVLDQFIVRQDPLNPLTDSETLEIYGSQVLLFAGFFRDHMSRRHNVTLYDRVGQSFYARASMYSRDTKKSQLFDNLSESFPWWTGVCRDLHKNLIDGRFLLNI
jgi:hypothetical protein